MDQIYFDSAATTPVDEIVMEKMLPYFTHHFGNANSAHQFGRDCKVAIEDAREKVASLINAEPSEIIFTSGGTESDNAAIKGVVAATRKTEVITSPIEHHAVIHPAESLKMQGCRITYLEPDQNGIISADKVKGAITDDTAVVSLMHVNNEIGAINPIKEIADVCREKGVAFHSDTVQSVGKIPIDVKELGMNLLSISAHKIYGPKGIGVLYVKNGTPWIPWMHGGSQERRRRGGTLNVPGIIGLVKAFELATEEIDSNIAHYSNLKKRLLNGLEKGFKDKFTINGNPDRSVPHIINLAFTDEQGNGIDGEMLLLNLDMEGICVSNGSACTSGAVEPSHVLQGLGMDPEIANSSIRISMGKSNTAEDIDYFLEKLETVLNRMMTTAAKA